MDLQHKTTLIQFNFPLEVTNAASAQEFLRTTFSDVAIQVCTRRRFEHMEGAS